MLKQHKQTRFFSQEGFTFIEIIVSLVLVALILAGLASLFLGAKRWIAHRRYQLAGGQLGKVFLEPLQMDVRQDLWASNCLGANGGAGCPGQQTIGNMPYNPTYAIDNVAMANCPTGDCLKRVILSIGWTEPTS